MKTCMNKKFIDLYIFEWNVEMKYYSGEKKQQQQKEEEEKKQQKRQTRVKSHEKRTKM